MKQIFFCGEVVADLFEVTNTAQSNQNSSHFALRLGGSQYFSAVGAARLLGDFGLKEDIIAGFVGPISQDLFGNRFIEDFQSKNVDTRYVVRIANNTTLAIVSIRPGHENEFVFYGRDTASRMANLYDLPEKLTTESAILSFGSLSSVLEPAGSTWFEFARRHAQTHIQFYDLNTRPSLIDSREWYQNRLQDWASTVSIMKGSDADLGWTYPDMDIPAVGKLWLSHGVKLAVVTCGTKGAYAFTQNHAVHVPTEALSVTNTVGAGDNFNAGLLVALARRDIFKPDMITALDETTLKQIVAEANLSSNTHLRRQNTLEAA